MGQYDDICRECENGVITRDEQEQPCETCDGYGYLLTTKGHDLIEFLKRRGVSVSMSPRDEDDLQNMLGE